MAESPGARPPGKPRSKADMVRLVYISFATRDPSSADLEHIEGRSQVNNLVDGITGLLIAQGRFFYGVVEGPRRRVMDRMEVIITDDRHFGLRILREEPIAVRRFANWSFARLPDGAIRRLGDVTPDNFILELSRRLA
jgi:Sensors of blue-light using FAD